MAGAAKYKLGPGPSNTNWGLGQGQETQIPLKNVTFPYYKF